MVVGRTAGRRHGQQRVDLVGSSDPRLAVGEPVVMSRPLGIAVPDQAPAVPLVTSWRL